MREVDSEEDDRPDPWQLKEEARKAADKNAWDLAVELWRLALKECLKRSCQTPTKELYDMSLALRLNLCLGFLKQAEWLEALKHVEVVLGQDPQNVKALYRRAQIHLHLQEWDECVEVLEKLRQVDPDNKAALQMSLRVQRDATVYRSKCKKVFAGILQENKETQSSTFVNSDDIDAVTEESCEEICWRTTTDDPKSEFWTTKYSGSQLRKEKRPLLLSLPLTLLSVLEQIRNKPSEERIEKRDSEAVGTLLKRSKWTIHVVGVRGDTEMECMWTSILERLRPLNDLLLVCIGFMDETDFWGHKLTLHQTSPPMRKKVSASSDEAQNGTSGDRFLTCRLFKGYYQDFLEKYPRCLEDDRHPYSPDLVLIAEPQFSRFFNLWIPAIVPLLHTEKLTIFTGYSAVDEESHEAINLPPILKHLGAHFALPLCRNPFAIQILPDKDTPPMPLFAGYDQAPRLYSGPSAKNAVCVAVRGFENGMTDLPPLQPTLDWILTLQSTLKSMDIDVDVAEKAHAEFMLNYDKKCRVTTVNDLEK